VLVLQVRRAFQRHRPADMVLAASMSAFEKPRWREHVEGRVVQLFVGDAEGLGAEVLAQRPLVEDELDVEGGLGRRLDRFSISAGPKPLAFSEPWVDAGAWLSVP
jgi:hypothetical protein